MRAFSSDGRSGAARFPPLSRCHLALVLGLVEALQAFIYRRLDPHRAGRLAARLVDRRSLGLAHADGDDDPLAFRRPFPCHIVSIRVYGMGMLLGKLSCLYGISSRPVGSRADGELATPQPASVERRIAAHRGGPGVLGVIPGRSRPHSRRAGGARPSRYRGTARRAGLDRVGVTRVRGGDQQLDALAGVARARRRRLPRRRNRHHQRRRRVQNQLEQRRRALPATRRARHVGDRVHPVARRGAFLVPAQPGEARGAFRDHLHGVHGRSPTRKSPARYEPLAKSPNTAATSVTWTGVGRCALTRSG